MELPLLEPIYQKYKDQGFEIVAVDVRADDAGAKKFMAENGLTYTMLSGNVELASQSYGISSVPSSFLISGDGTIVATGGAYNKNNIAELDKKIGSFLK